jgi:hypothetical protein
MWFDGADTIFSHQRRRLGAFTIKPAWFTVAISISAD